MGLDEGTLTKKSLKRKSLNVKGCLGGFPTSKYLLAQRLHEAEWEMAVTTIMIFNPRRNEKPQELHFPSVNSLPPMC